MQKTLNAKNAFSSRKTKAQKGTKDQNQQK